MIVQSACQVRAPRPAATESLGRPKCPRCGSVLLIAEESRFSVSGRIDHSWTCDDCSHEFVTSIRIWRR